MFDPQKLAEVLSLHEKSYALLRWVRAALNAKQVSFSVLHENTDSAAAACEWISRHLKNLPQDARPAVDQIPTFARLFVSFLVTSYKLNANGTRLISYSGCRCSYCSFLQAGPHLDARVPLKRDYQVAHELKQIYVGERAKELGANDIRTLVDSVLSTKDLAESVAAATWGAELIRRSEFASQGEAVLALWRQFAWLGERPKPKFQVTSKYLLGAEQAVVRSLQLSMSA